MERDVWAGNEGGCDGRTRVWQRSLRMGSVFGAMIVLFAACGDGTSSASDTSPDQLGETDLAGAEVSDTQDPGETSNPGDAADAPDNAGPDAAGTLESGETCTEDEQCVSEWCVPSALGPICVPLCGEGCEDGWVCVPASGNSSDPVSLCIPLTVPDPPLGDTSDTSAPSDTSSPGDTSSPSDTTADTGSPSDTTADTGSPSDTTTDTGNPLGDDDGDGIPNDEDNLPCLAIILTVFNDDVTSATVELNDQEVVGSNAFPTEDPITLYINPVSGENTLSLGGKLGGSPRDSLTLLVSDTQGNVYFTIVIVRQPGMPQTQSFTFVIDATCP